MRDDLAALNIGQAEKEYRQNFFWRSYRDIEMFMTRVLSKGPVEVSTLRADDITVSGDLTLEGELIVDLSDNNVEVGSLEVVGNATVGGNLTTSGSFVAGYVRIDNAASAYLRLKDTGQTGNSVSAGLDMVGSNDAGRLFLGTDGTTSAGYLTSYTGNLVLTATGGVISAVNSITPSVTGTLNLGSASLRWATVYTSDLSLKNDVGDWTIVEGEDDLFLYNNKKNRTYKFALIEVGTAPPKKV